MKGCKTSQESGKYTLNQSNQKTLRIKNSAEPTALRNAGKSTARGYNAPCFVGMVHFLRMSIDAYGSMGTEGTAKTFPISCH